LDAKNDQYCKLRFWEILTEADTTAP
jgi:hypothetical protein